MLSNDSIESKIDSVRIPAATPCSAGKRGSVPKRRYQEGNFRVENGHYYSLFYQDRGMADGSVRSVRSRFDLGKVGAISELSARREHDRLRTQINRERGSVPTAPKGETFKDAAEAYMESIAPHLSISTVRQRRSHLKHHLLPKFGASGLMALDVRTLQKFSTELLATCSRKTILNILGTLFGILDYAKKCGSRVPDGISFASLTLASDRGATETAYIRSEDAARIVFHSREPYRSIFALAWSTGLRAGELLGLTIGDLDFERKLIFARKQVDDRTRSLRELKTRSSAAPVAMTTEVEALLRSYIEAFRPSGLLFPNRHGRPRKRAYVVKFGLKPVLKKLGLPSKDVGLHAFRHGLGTALSNSKVSPKTVQQILRHADIKTTFRYYVHSDTDGQRKALESVALPPIGTNVLIGTTHVAK